MTSIDDVQRSRTSCTSAPRRFACGSPRVLNREHPRRTEVPAAAADSGSRPCVDRSRPLGVVYGLRRGTGLHRARHRRTWSATWPGAPSSTTSPESSPPATRSTCGSGHRWCTAASTGCGRSFIPTSPCCRSTRVPGRPSSASLHHAVPDALLSIRSAIVRPAPTVSPWLRQSRPDNSMTPTASTTGESCGRLPSPSSARVTSPRA